MLERNKRTYIFALARVVLSASTGFEDLGLS